MRKLLRYAGLSLFLLGIANLGFSQTAPFTESFTPAGLPTGWSNTSANASTNANWKFTGTPGNPSMTGSSYNPQVILDHTQNGGGIAWSDGSNPAVADCGLMTDSVDISALTSLYLDFWFYSNNVNNANGGNNTFYVNFYDGTQWNDSIWGYEGNGSAWQYVGIDLSTYTTSGKVLFEFVIDQSIMVSAFYNDILLDDISVGNVPACPLPISLASSNTTTTGATLSWSTVTSATSGYNILVGAQGFDPSLATAQTSATTSLAVTGLNASSFYDFYVVANCGTSGLSDTSGPATFVTGCGPVLTPYSQNFDNGGSGNTSNPNMPLCWTYNRHVNTTSNFTYGYTYNFNSQSAPNNFRLYSSGTAAAINDSLWITTPQIIGMSTTNKMMSFSARWLSTFNPEGSMWYGTMTDPTDKSTLTVMDTFTITSVNYEIFYLLFDSNNGYNGTDEYMSIGIVKGSTNNTSNLIDDVLIQDIPACFFPITLAASNITNNAADISWQSSGTAFSIEYGPAGFTQGTGVTSTTTTGSASLSGLFGNTTYDFYVQNNCAPLNGVSAWTGPFMFTTLCDALPGPIVEDFNTTATGTSTNPSPPTCWSYAKSIGFTGYGYTYQFGTPYSLPNHFRFYSPTASAGDWQMLVSPKLANITTNEAQVTFYARNQTNGTMVVGTMSNPADAAGFNPIDTINLTATDTYYSSIIDAAAGYNGTDEFVAIAMMNTGVFGTIYLDDITVQDKPNCFPSMIYSATSVSQNNVTLNWASGGGLAYEIEYGGEGFVQGTGTTITGLIDSSVVITGLTSSTCYDAYVRDSCASAYSTWFGPFTFCTICDPVNTVSEDFETPGNGNGTTQNPSQPNCWSYVQDVADNNFTYGYTWNNLANANSGTHSWYMYRRSSSTASDVVGLGSPEIDSLTAGTKKFNFSARIRFTGAYKTPLVVGTMSDPTDASTIHPLDTLILTSQIYNDYEYYIHPSSGYNGTDKFVFLGSMETVSSFSYILVDDVSITDVPACNEPINAGLVNVTSNSGQVDWASVSGSCFVVEYGPEGFIQGSGNGTTITAAASPLTIPGLSPNTGYDVYIRDCCDSSLWSSVVNFRTDCTSQLNGAYTVGGVPGPNNYTTLDSIIGVLNNCGLSGPVTINLSGGTHGAISIGNINGSSVANMITINGSVLGDSIVANTGMTVDLDGASNVSFDNLYIEAKGISSSYAIWMHNRAMNINITNSTIVANSSVTAATVFAIAATETNASMFSYGDNVENITVTGNTIIGGYIGVLVNGLSATIHNSGVTLTNNTFTDQYRYGIRINYMDAIHIEENTLSNFINVVSYGMDVNYSNDADVIKNEVDAFYGLYYQYVNTNSTTSVLSKVENNVFNAGRTGIYAYGSRNYNVYHNTASSYGTSAFDYACYVGGNQADSIKVRNNIFSANSGYAIYVNTILNEKDIDYNLYYGVGANLAYDGGLARIDLAALVLADAANNQNSVSSNPRFINSTNLRSIVGVAQNDVGDNTVGVTTDFDGVSRPISGSTTVDIGAFEYDPLSSDLQIESADLVRGDCLSANDTIVIEVKNVIGGTLNMAATSIVAEWSVTGPVNSNGTITVSSGTLDTDSILTLMATTVDMSLPGTYAYEANINLSSFNLSGLNDSLESQNTIVGEVFVVTPDSDTLTSLLDSADLKVVSPYFGLTNFVITEVCQWRTTTGTPLGGWPAYFTGDDYIEITGIAGSDLGGITLEYYLGVARTVNYTFPANTILSPNGTAIIMTGQTGAASQPANYYYDGRGGSTQTYSSGSQTGTVLKDASGNVIDAVASNGYLFPVSSGVTSAHWAGAIASSSGTSGIRLNGADNNLAADWGVSSAVNQQDPNAINTGVAAPVAGSIVGLSWSLNGTVLDTIPEITVNPGANGLYNYIVTYVHPCSTFVDTVPVYVNIPGQCVDITNTASTVDCFEMVVSWTSDATSTGSFLEYGPVGYTPGSGTAKQYVTSPDTITNLVAGTAYDVYLVDSCSGGVTAAALIQNTTNSDPVAGSYTQNQSATTLTFATVDFDATASTGNISTYTWNFGDGNQGTGMTVSNNYANNGTYYTTLVIANACAADTVKDTVEVYGITVEETMVDQTISIYPNPNTGQFRIEFDLEGLKEVNVRVMDGIGREVYNRDAGKVSGSFRENVDISNLSKGVYIVQVISDGHLTSRKITVQ